MRAKANSAAVSRKLKGENKQFFFCSTQISIPKAANDAIHEASSLVILIVVAFD